MNLMSLYFIIINLNVTETDEFYFNLLIIPFQ